MIDLMAPRWKCIADYPRNTFNVGNVFSVGDNGRETQIKFGKYPHLFRKLYWWEDRKSWDMPKFVKIVFTHSGGDIIIKPFNYSDHSYDAQYNIRGETEYLAATEAEYLSFKASQK